MNLFPQSVTQHCVIEEQDDHIVIALRIPKSEIAANIHLLAGLACVVPRQEAAQAGAISRRVIKASIICGGLILSAAWVGLSMSLSAQPVTAASRVVCMAT